MRQGFEPYCPRYKLKTATKTLIKPLFPRYIFILIDKVWHSIKSTRGISYVLLGEDGPQFISERLIMAIKARESAGFVTLEPPLKFLKGDKVKTDEGPLAGLPLFYEGTTSPERVQCLVELLGRKVVVTLPEKSLVAA